MLIIKKCRWNLISFLLTLSLTLPVLILKITCIHAISSLQFLIYAYLIFLIINLCVVTFLILLLFTLFTFRMLFTHLQVYLQLCVLSLSISLLFLVFTLFLIFQPIIFLLFLFFLFLDSRLRLHFFVSINLPEPPPSSLIYITATLSI